MDTKPLSPSRVRKHITESQITKWSGMFGSALRKANPFSSEAQNMMEKAANEVTSRIIGEVRQTMDEVVTEILNYKRGSFIVKTRVNRDHTREQLIARTERAQSVDNAAVMTLPLLEGSGEEDVTLVFFRADRNFYDWEIREERRGRGLIQDVAAQIQYNIDHPRFADRYPNGDSWKDGLGEDCFMCFNSSHDVRRVLIGREVAMWLHHYWYCGVLRKKAAPV